jgi:energy-coupling factor transporter ATP-binding protein EcfA2
MKLKSLTYSEFQNTSKAWSISDLTLEPINLVVGKNATGKTRTLNVLHAVGRLLSGRQKPSELSAVNFDILFEHDERILRYVLNIFDYKVTHELFSDGDNVLLERGNGGVGEIFHAKEQKNLEFQTPESDAAVVARRDTIQHPFLQPLSDWGLGVRHYSFGDTMGRTTIGLLIEGGPRPDPTNPNEVVGLFREGMREFPDTFKSAIERDMSEVGYDIEDIGIMTPTNIQVQSPFSVSPLVLFVKEKSLHDVIQQTEMSQGMFRTLSVIIHLQYAVVTERPSCVLIDDIGEGLDFDRSCRLINIIRRHAKDSSIQLVMSTNDRFVMNNVPLEEWSLLNRCGGTVKVYNYKNSQEKFDNFKFTGLNNFDFLAMDFINESEESFAVDSELHG